MNFYQFIDFYIPKTLAAQGFFHFPGNWSPSKSIESKCGGLLACIGFCTIEEKAILQHENDLRRFDDFLRISTYSANSIDRKPASVKGVRDFKQVGFFCRMFHRNHAVYGFLQRN
jgi:hypothetical protein